METSELQEDIDLRKLMGEFDIICKEKEDQEDKLENARSKNKDLEESYSQLQQDITK